ncbi:DEAD-box ATP-dependent RNA helicase 56-like isoform X2 [Melia azedarach]|uniref:DEAD-box ATP-dependent RNA helicase 56-like isoform X2 n=1 Tax=Melia azedarach TaxID=155640 RepID=A0ACC1XVI5_MELAZ|nr:DEAD-box ATP-dependent RNA helicase 56-like isoform X2 [Melia azedarach]
MAPKRTRKSTQVDSQKFVSAKASERYINSLCNKIPISERGLDILEYSSKSIINSRKWQHFCEQPSAAIIPLVREFYANAREHTHGRIRIRGKEVRFDKDAINAYFSLPSIEDFDTYYKSVDINEMVQLLCPYGTIWKTTSKGVPISFPTKDMSPESRIWHYFISARILPTTHTSNVNLERAVLNYAIRTDKPIDVGSILYNNILYSARTVSVGLYYPSLITDLCCQAGVPTDAREELQHPTATLTSNTIVKQLKKSSTNVASSSRPPSTSSRPLTRTDRLARIERSIQEHHEWAARQAQYQLECNKALEQIMKMCASHAGMDVTQFPTLPTCPDPLLFAQQPPSEDNVGDNTASNHA